MGRGNGGLRKRKRNPKKKQPKKLGNCVICLEKLSGSCYLVCGHQFHNNCINLWFNTFKQKTSEPSCPVCREEHNGKFYIKKQPRHFPWDLKCLSIILYISMIISVALLISRVYILTMMPLSKSSYLEQLRRIAGRFLPLEVHHQ